VKDITIGSESANYSTLENHDVIRCVVHPKYTRDSLDYDSAIVKVATIFVVSAVRKPISLVGAGEYAVVGDQAVVTGWGINRVSAYSTGSIVIRGPVYLRITLN